MTKMNDEALAALLGAETEIEKDVFIKRLNVNFRVKAIDGKTINKLREQATYYTGKGNKRKKQFDEEEFNASLIAEGCISPDFNNAKLQEKYGATSVNDCVQKALLAGEILLLQEAVLRLSGFDDGEEEIEAVKN